MKTKLLGFLLLAALLWLGLFLFRDAQTTARDLPFPVAARSVQTLPPATDDTENESASRQRRAMERSSAAPDTANGLAPSREAAPPLLLPYYMSAWPAFHYPDKAG